MAMVVAACSTSEPQQPASSPSTAQAPPEGQPPAPVAQDAAGSPPNAQPAQASTSEAAPQPAAAPVPVPPKPRVARLNAGQVLTVRTTRVLSAKTMKTGDVFSAILEEPIAVEGWVVAAAGARVEGRIVEADKGGRLKGKAGLSIELTSLTSSDGQKVEIVTTPVGHEAAAHGGKDAAKVGVGAAAGAGIGAIAGGGKGAAVGALIGGGAGAAMRGEAAEIAAGDRRVF